MIARTPLARNMWSPPQNGMVELRENLKHSSSTKLIAGQYCIACKLLPLHGDVFLLFCSEFSYRDCYRLLMSMKFSLNMM